RHAARLGDALHGMRRQLAENYLDRALLDSSSVEPDERLLWLARALQNVPADSPELEQAIRLNLSAWRQTLHPLRAVLRHDDTARCVALGPGGQLLSGCGNGTARLFVLSQQGEPAVQTVKHPHPVLAVAFDGKGRPLALLVDEEVARLVDARTGKLVAGP